MTTLTVDHAVYSADSHVVEPGNLWKDHIEPAFRDRCPHVRTSVPGPDGKPMEGEFLVCEGIAPQPVARFAAADVDDPRDRASAGKRGYGEIRAGGWDPVERIKDQDIDGVSFEVVYPSMAMPMFAIGDVPLQQAVFKAYNDWIIEFCQAAPERLAGIALIGLDDLDWAVKEMSRTRKLGLRGAMICNDPGRGRSYAEPGFDPIWAAAQDLDMPLSLHILTGREGTGLDRSRFIESYMCLHHPVQRSLAAILTTGVFARFPRLKVVSVENDIGWLGHFLHRLEHAYREFRYMVEYAGPLSPVEYFQRNCWATFQDDPLGVRTVDTIGTDRLMWASDYPHGDSTWPRSREAIERNFQGIDSTVVEKVTHDNVAGLYGI